MAFAQRPLFLVCIIMLKALRAYTLHPPSISIGFVFLTSSLLFSSWIARIPETQLRLGLSEGQLGLALLGLPLGSFCITPISGWILKKFHSGRATALSTYLYCLAIITPTFATGQWSLCFGLYLMGLSSGLLNVSMNAATAAVEKNLHLSIMSSCHGMFSLGAMLGAASAGLIAMQGIPHHVHLIVLASIMFILNFSIRPIILNLPQEESAGTALALPTKPLMGLALIGFCTMIGEGAVFDWSAVYLKNHLNSSAAVAGFGLAGFSLAMAIGRFSGDALRNRWGAKRIVQAGGWLGVLGLSLAILFPYPGIAILGFTIVGFGFSTIIPIIFSKAARLPGISPGAGIAAIATTGIIGFFIGPPLIGFISDAYGLANGLAFVACLSLIAAIGSSRMDL